MMFKRKFLIWVRDTVIGIGCSLLAAGFVAIVTPGTAPLYLALSLVMGTILIIAGLVVSFIID
jgi:hypothetical protein